MAWGKLWALLKPDVCKGCLLYGDGKGFVPDEYVEGAEVMVLGQNPGEVEERQGRPFVGSTGETMEKEMFPVAGLVRGENVSLGNVLRCRLQDGKKRTNDLPPERVLKAAIAHCMKEHYKPPATTRLVVAMGALAWRAMGGPGTVSDWRGFLK